MEFGVRVDVALPLVIGRRRRYPSCVTRTDRRDRLFAACLSALAGYVDALGFLSLEAAIAAGAEWQDGGEPALLIRVFRLATASQTNSAPLGSNTINFNLRPWIDLDDVNVITISGLVGITSLDLIAGLTETWSSAPPSSPPAQGQVVEYRQGVSLPASVVVTTTACSCSGERSQRRLLHGDRGACCMVTEARGAWA